MRWLLLEGEEEEEEERNIEKWFTIAKYLISTHFNKSSVAVPAPGSTSNNNT